MDDTILLRVNFTLLAGFAYVWNELAATIEVDTASDWDSPSQLFMGNFSRVLKNFRQRIPVSLALMGFNGVDRQTRGAAMPLGLLPRTPIQTPDGLATMNFHWAAQNTAAAVGAAGEVSFAASFFEFDLDQIQFFPANWSQSVTPR